MKFTSIAVVSFTSVFFLTGCATPFRDYDATANRAAIANLCEREKLISTQDFNSYVRFQFGEYAHQNMQIVDMPRLKTKYLNEFERGTKFLENASQSDRELLRLRCAQIPSSARVAPSQSAAFPQYFPPIPKTTNCMTTQGWTHCTTN
jgi:hypothetical protein